MAKKISVGFNDVAGTIIGTESSPELDNPYKILDQMAGLSEEPIPAITAVLAITKTIYGSELRDSDGKEVKGMNEILDKYSDKVIDQIDPAYITDDGMLSREEQIKLLSKLGHDAYTPEDKEAKPAQALIDKAAKMLKKMGIEDEDGQIAEGLAKVAVVSALEQQTTNSLVEEGIATRPDAAPSRPAAVPAS